MSKIGGALIPVGAHGLQAFVEVRITPPERGAPVFGLGLVNPNALGSSMSMDTVKKLGLRPTHPEYPDFAMYEAVLDIVGLSQNHPARRFLGSDWDPHDTVEQRVICRIGADILADAVFVYNGPKKVFSLEFPDAD